MKYGVILVAVCRGFGVHEDFHGRTDPSTYEAAVFGASERYSTPSNLLQRNKGSFVQKYSSPFSTLEQVKVAQVHLEQAEEQRADKEQITRSKIEVFKQDLENQIAAAQKEKKDADERIARRGGLGGSSSSFSQLGTDFTTRELEKVNGMQRSWKLAADRLAHMDLNSIEPDARLVDANSRVDADRKKMKRISAKIEEDLRKVENDASLVAADQARLKKEQAAREH